MEVKPCWVVVLPGKRFNMVGEPCTMEEALAYVRSIWPNAIGVE